MPWPTNPAEQYFGRGGWGWDGTQWRKHALTWGYSDVYSQAVYEPNVAAGDKVLVFSAVPAGQVWVINHVCAYSGQANATRVEFLVEVEGVQINVVRAAYPTANLSVNWDGFLVMKPTDYIQVVFRGCVLNDDLWAQAAGYRMKVT